MDKYHYEYSVFTDNLNYGCLYLGRKKTYNEAYSLGKMANKGVFLIRKHRVYD